MPLEEVIKILPLLSAIVLYAIVAVQLLRDRFRTWTESFFVFGFFFAGTYALSDFFFFGALTSEAAFFAARISLSSITLCPLFFFLFTAVFLRSMKKEYLIAALPTLFVLVTVWDGLSIGVMQTSWGWVVIYDSRLFMIWLLYIVIYISFGIWNMFRTYEIAKSMSKTISSRTLGIMLAFIASLALGLCTNGLFAATGMDSIPMFSTFFMLPGLATLMVVLPLTREKVANATKYWKTNRYEVMATYLVHADGTLIVSRSAIPEMNVDKDIFSATLDVIQNFMRTSFPFLSGNWLKTIDHGDTKIMIERGKFTFLALVVKGEENDILRRQMKDILATFELKNGERLTNWRGIAQEAKDTDQVLNAFFAREVMF